LRHAATDHASAADPVFLGDHHLGAVARGDARGAHATRAAADDEKIHVVLSHDLIPNLPPCHTSRPAPVPILLWSRRRPVGHSGADTRQSALLMPMKLTRPIAGLVLLLASVTPGTAETLRI